MNQEIPKPTGQAERVSTTIGRGSAGWGWTNRDPHAFEGESSALNAAPQQGRLA